MDYVEIIQFFFLLQLTVCASAHLLKNSGIIINACS